MPDVYVRPGGTPFGTSYASTPISPTDSAVEVPGLRLSVEPLLDSVPLGAPIRVRLTLTNDGDEPAEVPAEISLGSGFVRGEVVDPSGAKRSFDPLVLCVDAEEFRTLAPGTAITNSLTLLRGGQGALFPAPGLYQIRAEAHWDLGGMDASVTGEGSVLVSSVVDEAHGRAALHVLSTPDAHLTLVLGGDHLTEGIDAIQDALQNPVLRPHYEFIEAKRLAQRFGKRRPDLKAAAALIDAETVKRAVQIASDAGEGAASKAFVKSLKTKVAALGTDDELTSLMDEL
jgi:hypothetical protein